LSRGSRSALSLATSTTALSCCFHKLKRSSHAVLASRPGLSAGDREVDAKNAS
jgi:hypothetical protein